MALFALSKSNFPPLSVEQATGISIHTLAVSGKKDRALGCGLQLAATLEQGKYFEVDGADHFSLTTNAEVQATVASFISKDIARSQQSNKRILL